MKQNSEKHSPIELIKLLFIAVIFTAAAALAGDLALRAIRLRCGGVETTAQVVETGNGGRRGHWVRYRFTVGNDPHSYVANDLLCLGRDITVNIAPNEWAQARNRGLLRVRYLPSNPDLNLPAHAVPWDENPWLSGIATVFMGLVALMGWVTVISAVRQRRATR